MLIVFTAMLGYDRKTAVGTSTLIMTFTALIASVSHILMEPDIIWECWDYLLVSIVTATFFSLVSARFANKVKAKEVGIVTGATLLLLGIAMIVINNIEKINRVYLMEFLKLAGIYIGYIAVLAVLLIVVRFATKVPDYIFRKLLHVVAFTSILPLAFGTENAWIAVGVEVLFLILVIVILHFCESLSFYKNLFVEKGKHEVIISFVLLFGLMTVLLAVFWGILGAGCKYIAVTAIMAWGPGDAVAAIVGKNVGKHKLEGKMIEGVKSVEGSVGMLVTSFVCTFVSLMLLTGFSWYEALTVALVVAIAAMFTELFTKKGLDTVTVPVVACLILFCSIS